MQEQENTTVWTCDGCGKEYLQRENGDLPLGYYGSFMHHHGLGGDGGDFFACRRACLAKAFDAAEMNR